MQRLLIDGYNLLHLGGFVGRGRAPGKMQRARQNLIRRLDRALPLELALRTKIVFDSSQDGPSSPVSAPSPKGIEVEFATGYDSADARLIELVRRHSHPRRLVVVSSDHAIRAAARRRRATIVLSEEFWDRCEDGRLLSLVAICDVPPQEPPEKTLPQQDPQYWVDVFLDEGLDED